VSWTWPKHTKWPWAVVAAAGDVAEAGAAVAAGEVAVVMVAGSASTTAEDGAVAAVAVVADTEAGIRQGRRPVLNSLPVHPHLLLSRRCRHLCRAATQLRV